MPCQHVDGAAHDNISELFNKDNVCCQEAKPVDMPVFLSTKMLVMSRICVYLKMTNVTEELVNIAHACRQGARSV